MRQIFGQRKKGALYFNRESAYLLCVRQGLVAVIQTPKGYFLPGGGLNAGESYCHYIQRELGEETGRTAKLERYLCTAEAYSHHEIFGLFHPVHAYFIGSLDRQMQQPCEPNHLLVWLPLHYAGGHMYAQLQGSAIRYYLDKIAALPHTNLCCQTT